MKFKMDIQFHREVEAETVEEAFEKYYKEAERATSHSVQPLKTFIKNYGVYNNKYMKLNVE